VLAIMRALVDAPDGARPGHTRPNPIQPDPTGLEPPHAPGGAAPPDTPDGPGLTDDERAELELALERARRGGS
jgi:hypothetical protein